MTTAYQKELLTREIAKAQAVSLVQELFGLEVPEENLHEILTSYDLTDLTQAQIDDIVINDLFIDKIKVVYDFRPGMSHCNPIVLHYDGFRHIDFTYNQWNTKASKICYAFLSKFKKVETLTRLDKARLKCLRGMVWTKLIDARSQYHDSITAIPLVIKTELQRDLRDPTNYAPKDAGYLLELYSKLSDGCKRDIMQLDPASPLIPIMVHFNFNFMQLVNAFGFHFTRSISTTSKTRARTMLKHITVRNYHIGGNLCVLARDYKSRLYFFKILIDNNVIFSSKYMESIPWFKSQDHTDAFISLAYENLTSAQFSAKAHKLCYDLASPRHASLVLDEVAI